MGLLGKLSSFGRLKAGLQKSSAGILTGLKQAIGLSGGTLDAATLDALEDALLRADVGVEMTDSLLQKLQKHKFEDDASLEDVKTILADNMAAALAPYAAPFPTATGKPQIVVMVGVNGSGKTTTTAKLAQLWQDGGKQVRLVAADTFRAGAVEQLNTWAQRTNTPITLPAKAGADAAALAYTGHSAALAEGADILLVDTAGRLQNRQDLMAELTKIISTLGKQTGEVVTLLVLDGTVGQNAISQAESFAAAAKIDGVIVTKLDSSAKGGIVLALAQRCKLPLYFVGVGETTADLQPFNAENYAKALLDLS